MTEQKKKNVSGMILSAVVFVLGMVIVLMIIYANSKKDDVIILTYAEVNPINGTIAGEMAKAFKEKTEELSGGQIQIDVQAGGVLGSEDQILDNLL